MNPSRTLGIAPILVVLIATAMLIAGCASNDGAKASGNTTAATDDGAPTLSHVDGTVEVIGGEMLSVTPSHAGEEPVTLSIGADVSQAELQAFAQAAQVVRVYFEDDDSPEALRVEEAPAPTDGTESATGTVTSVAKAELTIETEAGPQTFTIREADRAAFEAGHLTEHREDGSPIKVYFETDAGVKFAVAYEDA